MQKESAWTKLKNWSKSPQGKKAIPIIIIVLVILGFLGYTIYKRYFKSETPEVIEEISETFTGEEDNTQMCKLDGMMYDPEDANRHPLAIMVENHSVSRPHAGLSDASIIYEAIAEGGITRFMPIYGPNVPEKVGPVRSARTYFLDWALEYDAYFAHVGGNMDALDLIPEMGIKDLDQFSIGSQAYWREARGSRATEHTMYTDPQTLYEIAAAKGWNNESSDFTALDFKSDIDPNARPADQTVTINFSTNTYKVTWDYEPESNQYLRYMADSPHIDELTDVHLTAKNIIVQTVDRAATTTRINENGWIYDTVGEGPAKIYLDGTEIDATWKKPNQAARTIFYDSQGQEIEFNPGIFWYEIVHPDTTVTSEVIPAETTPSE